MNSLSRRMYNFAVYIDFLDFMLGYELALNDFYRIVHKRLVARLRGALSSEKAPLLEF